MANPEQLEEQREETRLIIEELLEDGSDPDALYTIEHHLSADDLETLEKAAVEAFKLGYEVTDPEELEVEDGDIVICCDILSECALNADLIDAQVEQLMTLAEKFDVEYDGMTLVGGLLVMVMFSGYENFVSQLDISENKEKLNWLGKMDATSLKNKVAASIVAISSIHLLRVFMDAKNVPDNKLMWYVIIHLTFVLSAFVMGYLDRLTRHNH